MTQKYSIAQARHNLAALVHELEKIESYLNEVVARTMPVLPYDERAAQWHAAERSRLTASGKTSAFAHGQIAAIAAINELTLVTFNPSDFANSPICP